MKCPKCSNNHIVKDGKQITRRGKLQRYLCENGHVFTK